MDFFEQTKTLELQVLYQIALDLSRCWRMFFYVSCHCLFSFDDYMNTLWYTHYESFLIVFFRGEHVERYDRCILTAIKSQNAGFGYVQYNIRVTNASHCLGSAIRDGFMCFNSISNNLQIILANNMFVGEIPDLGLLKELRVLNLCKWDSEQF